MALHYKTHPSITYDGNILTLLFIATKESLFQTFKNAEMSTIIVPMIPHMDDIVYFHLNMDTFN